MSARQYIGNFLMGLVPPTRGYGLKRRIFRRMGVEINGAPRIVSSVRILGEVRLKLGDDSFLGHEVLIAGGKSSVVIGACVDIAPRVSLLTGSHVVDMLGPHSAGQGVSQDIVIEDGVWIGAGATILGGVTIGSKAVIAAGSVVTHDIPPYTMAAGVPCRVRREWSPERQQWIVPAARAA